MMQRKTLPVIVQRSYNTYFYGALPLCIAHAHGHVNWSLNRYLRIFSSRQASGTPPHGITFPYTHIDFLDAFDYQELFSMKVLEEDEWSAIGSFSQYARDAVTAGSYVIAFVDDNYMRGRPGDPFLHEILIYGFDDSHRTVLVVAFDDNEIFAELEFSYDTIDESFRRATKEIKGLPSTTDIRRPIQLLTPAESDEDLDTRSVIRQLIQHHNNTPGPLDSYSSGFWWGAIADYSSAEVAFGLATYDHVVGHLHDVGLGSTTLDYRIFHLLVEQKRSIVERINLLSEHYPGLVAFQDPWRRFLQAAERERMRALQHSALQQQHDQPGRDPMLRAIRSTLEDSLVSLKATEEDLLAGSLHAVGLPDTDIHRPSAT